MSNAVSDGTHWATPRVCQSRATVVRQCGSVSVYGLSTGYVCEDDHIECVVSEKMMSFISWR